MWVEEEARRKGVGRGGLEVKKRGRVREIGGLLKRLGDTGGTQLGVNRA